MRIDPPETIIAEKLQAMIKLGIANSRMKDFFDVYMLARTREFDASLLARAVARTCARRKTMIPENPFALTAEFYADRAKRAQWRAFLAKTGVDAPNEFAEIGELLREFLLPIIKTARTL